MKYENINNSDLDGMSLASFCQRRAVQSLDSRHDPKIWTDDDFMFLSPRLHPQDHPSYTQVSLKRFYFALSDDGLTLKTLEMAYIVFLHSNSSYTCIISTLTIELYRCLYDFILLKTKAWTTFYGLLIVILTSQIWTNELKFKSPELHPQDPSYSVWHVNHKQHCIASWQ